MFFDFIYRFWNNKANDRYKLYKQKQTIEKNKKQQFKNKVKKYNMSIGEYYSLQSYR